METKLSGTQDKLKVLSLQAIGKNTTAVSKYKRSGVVRLAREEEEDHGGSDVEGFEEGRYL